MKFTALLPGSFKPGRAAPVVPAALSLATKLSLQRYFTGRERAHAEFLLVGIPHHAIDFPGSIGCVICLTTLLADISRDILDHDDFTGSMGKKFRCSLAEFSFTEAATIRNHGLPHLSSGDDETIFPERPAIVFSCDLTLRSSFTRSSSGGRASGQIPRFRRRSRTSWLF